MDIELFKTIGTFAAIFAAIATASLNGLGYLLKRKDDKHKTLNEALSCLLEIWRISNSFDRTEATELLLQALQDRLPGHTVPDNFKEFYRHWYNKISSEMVNDLIAVRGEGLRDRYTAIVQDLSGVLPFLAYGINANKLVLFVVHLVDRHEQRVREQLPQVDDPNFEKLFSNTVNLVRSKVYKDAHDSLEEDILTVADACGPEFLKKAKEEIQISKEARTQEIKERIKGLLDLIPFTDNPDAPIPPSH